MDNAAHRGKEEHESTPDVSIIIPAYNEEKRLPGTLDKIIQYIEQAKLNAEIIVVIEKGTDNTNFIVSEYRAKYHYIKSLSNDGKYGKGYSVRRGVMASRGEYVLFTDSDLSVPIENISKMMELLAKGCDCCIGDREQVVKQPAYRIFMGIVFRLLTRTITNLEFLDTQCGFKMFNRKFAHDVFGIMTTNGFAFDVEMLLLAKRFNYSVKAIKVEWFNGTDSKVNPIKDSFNMFVEVLRMKKKVKSYRVD